MTLFDIADQHDTEPQNVRVAETKVGKGVFAVQNYPATAIIGEITGRLFRDPDDSSEYTFDYEDGLHLDPNEPFRYLNHSCEPNCEFQILSQPSLENGSDSRHLFLIALQNIRAEEEFTISYNWPAASTMRCECGSENCVGWIVCETEFWLVIDPDDDDFESEYEFRNIGFYFPDAG